MGLHVVFKTQLELPLCLNCQLASKSFAAHPFTLSPEP